MTNHANVTSVGREAIADHDRIRQEIELTRSALAELDVTAPHPHDFERVSTRLRDLAGRLRSHFRAEETASLHERLQDVLTVAAEVELTRLREEHSTLLAELEQAEKESRRCTPLSAVRLHRDVGTLLVSLERHEAAENELMAQAFGVV